MSDPNITSQAEKPPPEWQGWSTDPNHGPIAGEKRDIIEQLEAAKRGFESLGTGSASIEKAIWEIERLRRMLAAETADNDDLRCTLGELTNVP